MMRMCSATDKYNGLMGCALVIDGFAEAGGSRSMSTKRINGENGHCYREVKQIDEKPTGNRRFC